MTAAVRSHTAARSTGEPCMCVHPSQFPFGRSTEESAGTLQLIGSARATSRTLTRRMHRSAVTCLSHTMTQIVSRRGQTCCLIWSAQTKHPFQATAPRVRQGLLSSFNLLEQQPASSHGRDGASYVRNDVAGRRGLPIPTRPRLSLVTRLPGSGKGGVCA